MYRPIPRRLCLDAFNEYQCNRPDSCLKRVEVDGDPCSSALSIGCGNGSAVSPHDRIDEGQAEPVAVGLWSLHLRSKR